MGMKIGENDRKEARKEGVHRIGPRSYAAISISRALPSGFINLGKEREEKKRALRPKESSTRGTHPFERKTRILVRDTTRKVRREKEGEE